MGIGLWQKGRKEEGKSYTHTFNCPYIGIGRFMKAMATQIQEIGTGTFTISNGVDLWIGHNLLYFILILLISKN